MARKKLIFKKGGTKVFEIDRGWKKLISMIDAAKTKPFVKVGWPAESDESAELHAGSAFTNLDIAIVHEFGAPGANVPERSHTRASYDANIVQINAFKKQLALQLIDGKITIDRALELLGLFGVSYHKKFIKAGIPPALTGRAGTPLIDTGQLINSLSFKKFRFGKGKR